MNTKLKNAVGGGLLTLAMLAPAARSLRSYVPTLEGE